MGGKHKRVKYSLNTGDTSNLAEEEIKAILRAADELINTGGRSMLAKILKGSKDRKILEYHLDNCPSYGYYNSITLENITHKIDWMIKNNYLNIVYNGRLPILVFSDLGWSIERETYAEELFHKITDDADQYSLKVINEMKNTNREVVYDVLEKIRKTGDGKYIETLEKWKAVEVRKVRERISSVIRSIEEL